MKAIILAAGLGSRLAPLTDSSPKSLLTVGGTPILKRQIDSILTSGISDIVVVTGYKAEMIKDFISENYPQISVEYIYNENYNSTNTAYSLWLTRDSVTGHELVKFDADVVFDQEILEKLINSTGDLCFTIDRNINLANEEVKVKIDENGKILKIGKEILPSEAVGESIGIDKVSQETNERLFLVLEELLQDPANHQAYYEAAFELLIDEGANCTINDITGHTWTEIDSHEDFALANQLFPE